MTTYLGLTRRAAIAAALVAVTVGGAIGLAIPAPDPAPCGLVADSGGTLVPASCSTADELADRLDVIRETRTGGRFAG